MKTTLQQYIQWLTVTETLLWHNKSTTMYIFHIKILKAQMITMPSWKSILTKILKWWLHIWNISHTYNTLPTKSLHVIKQVYQ